MKYLYLFALLIWCGGFCSYGQQTTPLVTGDFQQLPLTQFAAQLEAQTAHRIFFDSVATQGITVTLRVAQQPLRTVIEQALQPSGLHVAVDEQRNVFIFSGTAFSTTLPENYFRPQPTEASPELAALPAPASADRPAPAAAVATTASSPARQYVVGAPQAGRSSNARVTVTGFVREAKSGEPVIGASVASEALTLGAVTNRDGYYSLTLPVGEHLLSIRGIGLKPTQRRILLHSHGKLDIVAEEDITTLKEVVVQGEKNSNVAGLQMGVERLDIRAIRQVPTVFGEVDILRVVMTLPGVKTIGEGSTSISVRGGGTDQNLILFDDAVVYSPAHLFGFFSAFNPEMLKTVELYKSGIPAQYGGRLSSVLNITTREGNKQKLAGSGGVGLLTSRLTLEGPLVKNKGSFIIGGRTSYSDWLLRQLPDRSLRQSAASFYDVSAHLTHELNANNTFSATGYLSRDRFKLSADTSYEYHNQSASLKWKHVFGPQLFGVLTATGSQYTYRIASERNAVTSSALTFGIAQLGGQADFTYLPSPAHTLDFGASSTRYRTSPGRLTPLGPESLILPDVLPREQGQESAVYLADQWNLTPRLALYLGLRYSLYQALGPREVFEYLPGVPRSLSSLTDTVRYRAGSRLATYHGPEYRASLKFALSEKASVKVSYNRTRQYLHQLSNTASISPADTWKLSDQHVRPQIGDQVALGFYRNFGSNSLETSVETYYKKLRDFVDYTSGAVLLLNHHIETDLVNAEGKAYGVEVSVKKTTGKINGWLNYTYSRSLVRVPATTESEFINGGRYYRSNFDKPHDVSLAGNYRFSRRVSTSLNVNYSTGRPITLPISTYDYGGVERVLYSNRNQYRIPDYFRTDLGLNVEGSHKAKKLAHSSWTFSVYNLTGRRNPYSVYFKSTNGRIVGYKLSVFGRPIPTVTYNFKF
ncbi:TonB-dependent receptor [Hymenobacter sp. BT186]|uniref:TonB-dependent receptor n=1 Tax=Hymenobacter telluris TaxID=2816474 RepID=A0A939EXB4_9BACT|nr:TonB-dependent receptor [Hymenobacter telluris]MBO0359220.1 TonB-dependent receptor [Hymenobacter telluris]MBW3375246.1 TonB-dependent receptor [Hymenobacter norwichensis]